MKLIVCLIIMSLALAASLSVDKSFEDWTKQHKKQYSSVSETIRRYEAFKANSALVARHNAEAARGKHTYTLGMNKFADMTNAEYRSMLGYRARNTTRTNLYKPDYSIKVGDSIDWRDKGVVTPVKDQGQCGSCWSFSATGSMEGAHAISTGSLVSLSEQNLIDCVQGGSYTCTTGGVMQDGFQWVIDNSGIESEDAYPYCTCSGNACAFDQSQVVATISSFQNLPSGDENALQQAVGSAGPVSIAIDASSQQFQLYSGGVFNNPSCSSTQLDHGVLVIGYGTSDGTDFWWVKNSWGEDWGLSGYIMMSRNANNQCGIATDASYPTV